MSSCCIQYGARVQDAFTIVQDPHFKVQNHRRRIISLSLLAEYAYLLAPGGRMYTITDVPELAEWMKSKVLAHPSFRPLTQEELDADVAAGLLITSSEEGQKVERNNGQVGSANDTCMMCLNLVFRPDDQIALIKHCIQLKQGLLLQQAHSCEYGKGQELMSRPQC